MAGSRPAASRAARRHGIAARILRLDEMIGVLRQLWAGGTVEHHGDAFDFGPLSIAPTPDRPAPIYVGGDSEPALRRAALAGDGWIGNRIYTEDELTSLLARLESDLGKRGRTLDDLHVIAPLRAADPDVCRRLARRGLDGTLCVPWWRPTPQERAHHGTGAELKIAAIERFAVDVIAQT